MTSVMSLIVSKTRHLAKSVAILMTWLMAFGAATVAHSSETIDIKGLWKGKEKTTDGKLYLPKNKKDPFPTVVMIHGTGGDLGRYSFHREGFLEAGIATFEVDFKSGFFRSQADRPAPRLLIPFAYGALEALRKIAAVDPTRIGLMGFSFGGAITIDTMEHVQKLKALGGSERGFSAHVAYYPGCRFRDVLMSTCAPLLVIAGEKDSYGDGKTCGGWVDSFNEINPGLGSVKIYPGVHHGFDGNKSWRGYDRAAIDGRAILVPNNAAAKDARRHDVMFFKKVFGMAGPYEFDQSTESCSYKPTDATANLDPHEAAKGLIEELSGLATMDSTMKADEALESGDLNGNKFWLEVHEIVTKIIENQ